MASGNRDYYLERARQEREKAEALRRGDPAQIAHRQMADLYEERAKRADQPIQTVISQQTG